MEHPTRELSSDLTRQPTSSSGERFLQNLQHFIADDQKADILYDHQKDIFHDTAHFLEAGERRGYIDAPTGTGKTVLFVSLAEAFSYKDPQPPKILVVTPTKDLVRQTLGGVNGDKGFAGFSPDLKVGTFYSDTPARHKNLEDQVTITTYASLSKLAAMRTTVKQADGTRTSVTVNQVNELYDIIFLDEGHKALGETSRQIIEELDDSKVIIGFTATPEYAASRRLEDLLPHMIHRLDLKEAINLGMLSPVIPLAIPAPETTVHEFIIGASGEYESKSLKQLVYNPTRNQMIINIATQFITEGNTPIIACIPGDNMIHPHMIAEQLSAQAYTDSDGNERLVRARAVTGAMAASVRQKLYAQLETGEIDALAYIDVLTEGWDSQRANVIINARPTRSLVAARQRMGRILRAKADDRPAVALDIVDPISSATAPQVSMADIFSLDIMKSGKAVGHMAEAFARQMASIVSRLTATYGYVAHVENLYTQYAVLLETLPKVSRGQAQIKQDGKIRTFATADRLFQRYDADTLLLDHFKQHGIETRPVRSNYQSIDAYDESHIQELVGRLPDSGKQGHGLTVGDKKYLSLTDIVSVIQRKYPKLNVTYRDIEKAIRHEITSPKDLHFTRRFRARTHRGVLLYTARTMVDLSIAQTIVTRFDAAVRIASEQQSSINTTEA